MSPRTLEDGKLPKPCMQGSFNIGRLSGCSAAGCLSCHFLSFSLLPLGQKSVSKLVLFDMRQTTQLLAALRVSSLDRLKQFSRTWCGWRRLIAMLRHHSALWTAFCGAHYSRTCKGRGILRSHRDGCESKIHQIAMTNSGIRRRDRPLKDQWMCNLFYLSVLALPFIASFYQVCYFLAPFIGVLGIPATKTSLFSFSSILFFAYFYCPLFFYFRIFSCGCCVLVYLIRSPKRDSSLARNHKSSALVSYLCFIIFNFWPPPRTTKYTRFCFDSFHFNRPFQYYQISLADMDYQSGGRGCFNCESWHMALLYLQMVISANFLWHPCISWGKPKSPAWFSVLFSAMYYSLGSI